MNNRVLQSGTYAYGNAFDSLTVADFPMDCLVNISEFLKVEDVRALRGSSRHLRDPMLTQHLYLAPNEKMLQTIARSERIEDVLVWIVSKLIHQDDLLNRFQQRVEHFFRKEETLRWFMRRNVILPQSATEKQLKTLVDKGYLNHVQMLDLSRCTKIDYRSCMEAKLALPQLSMRRPCVWGGVNLNELYYCAGGVLFFVTLYSFMTALTIIDTVREIIAGEGVLTSLMQAVKDQLSYGMLVIVASALSAYSLGGVVVTMVGNAFAAGLLFGDFNALNIDALNIDADVDLNDQ